MKRIASLASVAVVAALLSLEGCGPLPQAPGRPGGTAGLDKITSLDVYKDGATINLLLAGPIGKHTVMRYLKSGDGGASWSEPATVNSGGSPPRHLHRGNDAQVAAHGKHVLVIWSTAGSGWMGAGPMASAVSDDGGKTWRPAGDPGRGGTMGEAFIDAAAGAGGRFHVVWLDGRDGRQGLYGARSTDDGQHWSPVGTLDEATCQCCWNTLKLASHGHLYVLYRNVAPRDMALAVSADGGKSWRQRGPVGAFGWHFKACPHTGGGLAVATGAQGVVLYAVVWTGKKGRVGLHFLESTDDGSTWKRSRRIGKADARHADMAARDERHIAIVWDTATAVDSAVFAVRSNDGGRTWSAAKQLSAAGVQATHPRIVTTRDGYLVLWTTDKGDWQAERLSQK